MRNTYIYKFELSDKKNKFNLVRFSIKNTMYFLYRRFKIKLNFSEAILKCKKFDFYMY